MSSATEGFTIVRTLDASPEQVWRAWTEEEQAAQWWHPRGASTPRESVRFDVREGGRYTYAMVNDETGERVVTGGVFRELRPCERLVLTWGEPDADPAETSVITLTLEPAGEGTRLTFRLDGFPGAPGDENVYDGWDSALDVLAEHVARAA